MIGTFNHFVRQTFVRYYEQCGEPHTAGPGQMVEFVVEAVRAQPRP